MIHFPKQAQPIRNDESYELITPRDSKIRKMAMDQADSFLKAQEMRPDIMSTVRGVDACSSEIDCRPEVFACAIRKICSKRHSTSLLQNHGLPVMRITYHAGEDFLSPLDGLRAIDEAVCFCEMRAGDRLGHALALGIDVEEWYAQKGYTVLMHSEELLDNLVWAYGAMRRFGINNRTAENEIVKQFYQLYSDVYSLTNNHLLHNINIEQYLRSMMLRGNDPDLYIYNPESESAKFEKKWLNAEPWQIAAGVDDSVCTLSKLLYHCYHYDFMAKKSSDTVEYYKVPKEIIKAVADIQEKMQFSIAEKSIGIECNPSSNVLIGTFRDYLKHPIFRFNNRNLMLPGTNASDGTNPHINASVNTDDLGVFDTSLENEYALLVSALENYNDNAPDGKTIPKDAIFEWVDIVRENGIRQCF